MRKMRVCIYGGTDLQGTPTHLITALAYSILRAMPAVIVTGGFKHSNAKPDAKSTDVAALEGARRYAEEEGKALEDCYEAWIPEPRLDSRPDVKGAVRLGAEDGVKPVVMKGRTPLGRRLAMVASVDMVITISGRQHTEVVIEQALDQGIPVLPIPDAGGDSKDLLEKYRDRISTLFAPGALDACLTAVSKALKVPDQAADAIVQLIRTAKIGKCLVLLPYDTEHDLLYEQEIKPGVEHHMAVLRLDQHPRSDAISTTFASTIESCSAAIVDITHRNASVMYEVGFAVARGLAPLIYTRNKRRLSDLPVYYRALNIRLVDGNRTVAVLIDEYLSSLKERRSKHL